MPYFEGKGLDRELHKDINLSLFTSQNYDHLRSGVTAHKFNIDISTKTADCDLDMSIMGYTPTKWSMLQGLYLNYNALGLMVARLLHYKEKMTKSKPYIVDIGMNFKSRSNASGSCLLSMTIGYNTTNGWHCHVFTRASELTVRWYVDLIFINVLLREVGQIVGFNTNQVAVEWRIASAYQSITSMPLMLVMYGHEKFLTDRVEGVDEIPYLWTRSTVKRYIKCYLGDAYQNYGVQKRPALAYRVIKGLLPKKAPLTPDMLHLKPIMPYVEKAQADYTIGDDEDGEE